MHDNEGSTIIMLAKSRQAMDNIDVIQYHPA